MHETFQRVEHHSRSRYLKWALISTNESPNPYSVLMFIISFRFENIRIVRIVIVFHNQPEIIRTLLRFFPYEYNSVVHSMEAMYL